MCIYLELWSVYFPIICKVSAHEASLPDIYDLVWWILVMCRIRYIAIVKCLWPYTGYEVYLKSFLSGFSTTHIVLLIKVLLSAIFYWQHNVFKESHSEVMRAHLYFSPASLSQHSGFTEWPLLSDPTLFRISTLNSCWIYADNSSIRSVRISKVSITVLWCLLSRYLI